MAVAQLNRLTYWYPDAEVAALSDVSLTLDGGLTLVAGPSGGGKSTLLRVINGLVPHFHGGRIAGSALVLGMNTVGTPTRSLAREVGFVFQDPELQAVYGVVDREVAFGLENIGLPPAEMASRVADALDEAGAGALAGRKIRTLSGGERQRVALASALAMRPRVVVLDEPTSQLDPDGAVLVLEAATRLAAQGRAVVIAEHRLERLLPEAEALITVEAGGARTADRPSWQPIALPPPIPRRSPPGDVVWSLSGVTAGFEGHAVIDGVDLAGRSGEVVALAGPNGGGKTTLLRVIAGFLRPLLGTVERRPGRIAYLPQNPTALLHRRTLRDEVQLTIRLAGERESPETILDRLSLREVAGRYPRDLSCGQRQRAALAAVLPGRPSLVLLDEPTRGMDDGAREALVRLLAHLRDRGAAVILATHDAALRSAVADRVLNVRGGKVTEESPVQVAR